MPHVIAIDWSGKAKVEAESIWRAVVVDGRLVELENGLERTQIIQWIIDHAKQHEDTVVGLDFAFSFPDRFCSREGWRTGREVWDAMRERTDRLLEACEPPLWGRPGTKAQTMGRPLRQTESDVVAHPKSVFQIGGAGAVGTGSLRGMRHLAELADAGFAIWPFDGLTWPLVVEIYPRLFAPNVVKNRHRPRREHLHKHFPTRIQGSLNVRPDQKTLSTQPYRRSLWRRTRPTLIACHRLRPAPHSGSRDAFGRPRPMIPSRGAMDAAGFEPATSRV
jgi:hypothetical protein